MNNADCRMLRMDHGQDHGATSRHSDHRGLASVASRGRARGRGAARDQGRRHGTRHHDAHAGPRFRAGRGLSRLRGRDQPERALRRGAILRERDTGRREHLQRARRDARPGGGGARSEPRTQLLHDQLVRAVRQGQHRRGSHALRASGAGRRDAHPGRAARHVSRPLAGRPGRVRQDRRTARGRAVRRRDRRAARAPRGCRAATTRSTR